MLKSHLNAIENILIAQSKSAQNAGHPNLRGGPREWFIRDFLSTHLPSTLEIGQGELIDADSMPNPPRGNYRPQVDVVIYRRDLPKISYSTTDAAFLAEGVIATIESKSVLTDAELKNACDATIKHKSLNRQKNSVMQIGKVPDNIISYVVAFDGPQNMQTISGWMVEYVKQNNWIPEKMVDLVVVLGKGVLWRLDSFPELTIANRKSGNYWAYIDQPELNLFILFSHMLTWASASSSPPNVLSYVSKVPYQNVKLV